MKAFYALAIATALAAATTPPTKTPVTMVPKAAAPMANVTKTAACFARDSSVTLADGTVVAITDVKAGDRVLAVADDGHIISTPILRRTHDEVEAQVEFLRIKTASGSALEVTTGHYVFAGSCCHFHSAAGPKLAEEVKVGDSIFVADKASGKVVAQTVSAIESVTKVGAINVHTVTGTVLVNNVAATHFTTATTFGAAGRAYLAPVWYATLHYVIRPMGLGHHFGL